MKRLFLIFAIIIVSSSVVLADDTPPDNSNWGVPLSAPNVEVGPEAFQKNTPNQNEYKQEEDEQTLEEYGSVKSPSYLDRDKTTPNGSDDEGNYSFDAY